ncbi:class I SAM-dependent methyltransferase [Marinomonas sp. 2405UD68-3]|uniref:class I SAM-dependent methyltransferase n=1 Tax=Marinomonas sp. 2405UD68-3 TaxID=3391835 RepID=UPI0039C95055
MNSLEKYNGIEFSGNRSRSYKKALEDFPNVWVEDALLLEQYFSPREGENILEIGAGSGFFSFKIAEKIGISGHLIVVDPSLEQLSPINEANLPNISMISKAAEDLSLPSDTILNGIWSRGAFHHTNNKEGILKNLARFSKQGTRLTIVDIFTESVLAKYFDLHVAQSCTTGHEVSFLSKEFAISICKNSGWAAPRFHDIALQWQFDEKEDIGIFLSLLHSNKGSYSANDSLECAEALLGVKKTVEGWALNWPMTVMQTQIE